MTNQAKIQAARTLGSIAYANGIACVPAFDSELESLLTKEVSGLNIKMMKAWHNGWASAHVAKMIACAA